MNKLIPAALLCFCESVFAFCSPMPPSGNADMDRYNHNMYMNCISREMNDISNQVEMRRQNDLLEQQNKTLRQMEIDMRNQPTPAAPGLPCLRDPLTRRCI